MLRLWFAVFAAALVTEASAAECVFVAPNGFEASFEPGYLVIDQGSDDRWCQTEFSELGGIAECPSGEGIVEMNYSFDDAAMQFDGQTWKRRCFTPA